MRTPGELQRPPYLGLRFFDEPDAPLFCGRDDQVDDVLQKLAQGRFVAVIGSSGCGKSSLVRAGLVPALRAMGNWQVVAMRPGGDPIGQLAAAMEAAFPAEGLDLTLRRGRRGLIESVEQCRRAENWRLLLIVDQFEELFRFQRAQDSADQAADFVKLLLEAATQAGAGLCVLLTMRSDYLGNCSQFRDLPERINEGLYLVPRMRRDQMERAIEGPLRVSGGQMSPRLLQRVLNDVGDDPDQLPVLEHVLLRTWMQWSVGSAEGPLDLPHYEAVGGLNQVLERHADEIYAALPEPLQHCAAIVFRRLTEMDEGRAVRRPTPVAELVEVCGGESQAPNVYAVLDAFRANGVSFLLPEAPRPMGRQTIVDIAHESLIRQWRQLAAWALAEEADGRLYLELAGRAGQFADAQDYLSGNQLAKACQWLDKGFNAAWARRYGGDFEATVQYIQRSRQAARDAADTALHKERVMTLFALVGVLVLCLEAADLAPVFALAAAIAAWREWRRPAGAGRSRFETWVAVALVGFSLAAVLVAVERRLNLTAELRARQRSTELWERYQNLNIGFHQSELGRDLARVLGSRSPAVDRAEAALQSADLRRKFAQTEALEANRKADFAREREDRLRLGQAALELALVLGCLAVAAGRRILLAAAFASALAGVALVLWGGGY